MVNSETFLPFTIHYLPLTFLSPITFMLDYAEQVTKLIDEFKRLPGVGHKTAQRLAFHILRVPEADVERFVEALREVKRRIIFCSICNNLTDVDPCRFCASPSRDRSM